jgi:hypothetical protein
MTRSLLLLVAGLSLAGRAEAREHNRLVDSIRRQASCATACVTAVVTDDAAVARVAGEARSDAGREDLAFVETDAWLHGAATIAALPGDGAVVTLVLYDAGSAVVAKVPVTFYKTPSDVELVVGASVSDKRDVEVLAAAVYPAEKGYDVAFDLAGADVVDVAYATLVVDEKTSAEVGWDDVGGVWVAELGLAHEGALDVTVEALDADGKALDSATTELAEPWGDGGEGVSALPIDTGTHLALLGHTIGDSYADGHVRDRLVVVSEGWGSDDTVPDEAEVELDGGDTLWLPAHSYHRGGGTDFMVEDFRFVVGTARLVVDGDVVFDGLDEADVGVPLCSKGTCVLITEDDAGGLDLAVTATRADAADLPAAAKVSTTFFGPKGELLGSASAEIAFSDEVAAVFATDVGFAGDPVGVDLALAVTLRGGRGKGILAKGRAYASLTRQGDGGLGISGADAQAVESRGELVTGLGAVGSDDAPPAVVFAVSGNGSGTKNATTTTSARPRLL